MRIEGFDRQLERQPRSDIAAMQFPVHITLKLLAWRASMHVTDATGATLAFAPPAGRPAGQWRIYADERLGRPIFTIKADDPFTQFFDDAQGNRIGAFGITPAASRASASNTNPNGSIRWIGWSPTCRSSTR